MKWKKIFANLIDKGLISRMQKKKPLTTQQQKSIQLDLKTDKGSKQIFL